MSFSNYCFILTMWYVNNYIQIVKDEVKAGFILTMWYVNYKMAEYLEIADKVLY